MSSFLLLRALCCTLSFAAAAYEPTWESLDARPLPDWYDDVKFGVFITWGPYSVPAHGNEWYLQRLLTGADDNATRIWHQKTYGPKFSYADFGPLYKAELWDPNEWAQLFLEAGIKFTIFTAKFCDGWTHWKAASKWNYNSVDNGPSRDVVGEFSAAIKAAGIHLGFYYCNIEWGNPLLPWDYEHGPEPYEGQETYVNDVFLQELKDLTVKYEPDLINGDYCVLLNSSQLKSPDFLAWLYNESPVKDRVIVNDRWGTDCRCKHGGYWTCRDKFQPTAPVGHKWTDLMTMAGSWGWDRLETDADYKSANELITLLVNNVALGGNLALNVGPRADGKIPLIMMERLRAIGAWLKINGEAIYNTTMWRNFTETALTESFRVYAGMSNIDSKPPAPGKSAATVLYLGQTNTSEACAQLCAAANFTTKYGKPCLSFTWQANDCPQPQWSSTCYGETDSDWEPTVEPGHTTGTRLLTIYYTAAKREPGTVYAIAIGTLPSQTTLSLRLPKPSKGTQVAFLTGGGSVPVEWNGEAATAGVEIHLSSSMLLASSESAASVFKMTGIA